jgi:hypothetical protein
MTSPTENKTATDSDNGGPVGYAGTPVFQPIVHPVLNQLGQGNIRKFIRARDAYVRAISERREILGADKITPFSLRYSVDPDLLLSLIELAQFGADVDSLEKLSDDHITEWLRPYRDTQAEKTSLTRVDALISRGLHIRLQEKNISQRIMCLFVDYSTLLRSNGLLWIIKEKSKVAARHMV